MLGPSLYAVRGQKYIFYSLLQVIPVYLVIFSLLTYFFGLIGSAISWVLVIYFLAIFQYRYLMKLEPGMRISLKEIIKLDKYDKELIKKIFGTLRRRIS